MDGNQEQRPERAPRMRLSAEKRDRFLEVLGQTGNRKAAATAIGVEPRLMDQRRRFDPVLDRQWREAVEQADRRLAGAAGPLDCIGGAEPMVIRRGPHGRLRIVTAGSRRWSRAVENRFFAALTESGNIAAAACSIGFSASCIAQRRRKWSAFARRMEEALEDAEIALEFRMAVESQGHGEGFESAEGAGSGNPGLSALPKAGFDPEAAMRFLKWRAEKRRGGGHRAWPRKGLPDKTFDEARSSILRKIEAIERLENARRLADGWSQDENGYMIPPGWVRAQPPE